MIDFQRYLLIAAIAALSFMLLVEWRNFELPDSTTQSAALKKQSPSESDSTGTNDSPSSIDIPVASESTEVPEENGPVVTDADRIKITTDVLNIEIALQGGDVVYSALPNFTAKLESNDPFVVLSNNAERTYVAQSGLIGKNATDTANGRPTFSTSATRFSLQDGQDTLNVDLHYQYNQEVRLVKRFIFERGKYLINVEYLIDNGSSTDFQAKFFGQLKRDNSVDPSVDDKGGLFSMKPFMGVAYANNEDLYSKLAFPKMKDKPLKESVDGGWIGISQHYFLSAWVPPQDQTNQLNTVVTKQGMNIARMTGAEVSVPAGQQGKIGASLYTGPKDQYRLEGIAPGLDLTVDYGWLWWIAQPLFWLLTKIHGFLGNWGWSIIAVTVLIKAAFFQLNAKAFTSMANMRKVQPKLVDIKERYADDRQKQSQAMMELYKKEKINPLGGCLPMIVQMPVFISLYWVLMESIELRHAPFMLWINDLSAMDPYFILPVVMGISMFIQQKLNPPPPDPMQAKVMQWLPLIFTFFFLFFPAGLVLYWVVNNTLSIIQQYIITKGIEKKELAKT
ncbi:membrane protein insertase, YidC/Oxa1 family, N-terminal domain [Spongiibacter sp. IMCC21906]|uniref:membrane protein insertase YidC n=1 Tax=Spongiibacter sp. IMCC21906 TaxID=1620392 RepID=UPI00062DD33A|nr:membrane protein insertase YidC [Spongiibacter sp. IMCC21906]AKH68119.1 membrane protein insertase, YidC/Oxa1 family, N-terminal domain [Spongiibacter sp. IMCC21906]